MVKLNAHFDGKVIVPDEPTGLAPGTRLRVTLEPIDQPTTRSSGKLELPLLSGLDPQLVRSIIDGHDFDLENADTDDFLRSVTSEKPR
jgi:hypothetical protein